MLEGSCGAFTVASRRGDEGMYVYVEMRGCAIWWSGGNKQLIRESRAVTGGGLW